MKIAVVRNRQDRGVIQRLGQPTPERYGRRSVQSVLDALRACGHTARVFEGDMTMLSELKEYLALETNPGSGQGLVFNMSYGIQGEARYCAVPVMLEMAGVPYTGSGPRAHGVCLDKAVTKLLMREVGIPTPAFCLMSGPEDVGRASRLQYPLVVKPRYESTSCGLSVVTGPAALLTAVEQIVDNYRQDALVEEYIEGREFAVSLLGNDPVEVLPLTEIDFGNRQLRIMTGRDKFHKAEDEPRKLCPAPVDGELALRLRQTALEVFRACECRDYARVDVRVDRDGTPQVLEINSMASLGRGGAYVQSAATAGYDFADLIARIIDSAHRRYFGVPAPLNGDGEEKAWEPALSDSVLFSGVEPETGESLPFETFTTGPAPVEAESQGTA